MVIGYARVSTQEQAQSGLSLAAQEKRLRGWAQARDLPFRFFADAGVSGSVPFPDRPVGALAWAALSEEDSTHFIAAKLDRVSRDTQDFLATFSEVQARGVSLVLLDLDMDTTTPHGQAMMTIAAVFATLERKLTAQRTVDALLQVRAEGGTIGRAPFGYSYAPRAKEGGRRRLVECAEEQSLGEALVRMRRDGLSLRAICQVLSLTNTPTKRGGKWHPATVSRIVRDFTSDDQPNTGLPDGSPPKVERGAEHDAPTT